MAYTTINKSSLYMNPKLYTGNGSTNALTGVGFQPDVTWIKDRDASTNQMLFDAVRGVEKELVVSNTSAESTADNSLTAWGADGFTVGNSSNVNTNTNDIVSWNWKANGAGSSNTDGTITSTVSANTTAGFSIATWTGITGAGTMGHGLGGVDCIITKNTNSSRDWYFWNRTMAYNTRLEMNNTEAFTTGTDNMTQLPDATKIYWDDSTQNNGNAENYVGYFFQEISGYSKFGSYTGNGNADGTFVYTGFKPSFIMIKITSTTNNWLMWDNKRLGYNVDNNELVANTTDAESTDDRIDLLSNGFKFRSGGAANNSNGANYIYMAFGQTLVGTNNIPATAR